MVPGAGEPPSQYATGRIEGLLQATVETRVPLFLGLDGENWWLASNLSNWWDPTAPGYDPANRHNVEWTGPDGASNDSHVLKVSWRNWGRQLRVIPAQNIHSPAVLEATRQAFAVVIPIIARWYNALPPADRWLFAGIKVGWEACIGWNAFYYPDGNAIYEAHPHNESFDPVTGLNKSAPGAAWGAEQIGYAAAHSAGLQPSGAGGTLTRGDIESLIKMYLSNVTAMVLSHEGFPADRLFTHLGGTMVDHTGAAPHVSFSTGVPSGDPTKVGTLGISVYARPPGEQVGLASALDGGQPRGQRRWASVEWGLGMFWHPPGVAPGSVRAWTAAYNETLSWGDCRLLAFYNWNPGSSNVSLLAARAMLRAWEPPARL